MWGRPMWTLFYVWQLVVLHPVLNLGLGKTQDVLCGVLGSLTTAHVQEVQTLGSLIQIFLVACGIAQLAKAVCLLNFIELWHYLRAMSAE